MMISEYSFPAFLAERERLLEQAVERERLRRERSAPRPGLLERLALRRRPAAERRHAHA